MMTSCRNELTGTNGDSSSSEPKPVKLSELLWDIRWGEYFPKQLTSDGILVASVSYEDAIPFIQEHYSQIFQDSDDSPFYGGKITAARSRYYRIAGDFFAFKDGEKIIGILIGNPSDWGTYYLRSSGLLPEYEGKNLVQRLLPLLFTRLREANVERVESETAPSNMPMVYMLTRHRFNVSGTVLSERWGVLTRFTKFLDEASESVFLRQFCSGVRYQGKQQREAERRTA